MFKTAKQVKNCEISKKLQRLDGLQVLIGLCLDFLFKCISIKIRYTVYFYFLFRSGFDADDDKNDMEDEGLQAMKDIDNFERMVKISNERRKEKH